MDVAQDTGFEGALKPYRNKLGMQRQLTRALTHSFSVEVNGSDEGFVSVMPCGQWGTSAGLPQIPPHPTLFPQVKTEVTFPSADLGIMHNS